VEKEIIKLLFCGSEHIIGFIFDYVSPEGFSHAAYKKIAQIIFEEFEKDVYSPSAIIDKFTDESLRTLLLDLTISEEAISKKMGMNYLPREELHRTLRNRLLIPLLNIVF